MTDFLKIVKYYVLLSTCGKLSACARRCLNIAPGRWNRTVYWLYWLLQYLFNLQSFKTELAAEIHCPFNGHNVSSEAWFPQCFKPTKPKGLMEKTGWTKMHVFTQFIHFPHFWTYTSIYLMLKIPKSPFLSLDVAQEREFDYFSFV